MTYEYPEGRRRGVVRFTRAQIVQRYYQRHSGAKREAAQRWRERNLEYARERARQDIRQERLDAMKVIADYHGRTIECMRDRTPDHLAMQGTCRGPIELDHLNGGGGIDFAKNKSGTAFGQSETTVYFVGSITDDKRK